MKDKLTLEELAAYYPHDINAIDNDGIPCKITSLFNNCVGVEYEMNVGEYEKEFNEIQLVLHPLSDLTKEIEVNGEKFVPIEWFEIGDDENSSMEYDNGNIKLIRSLESLSKNGFVNDINYLPFGVVQKLLSWQFDIFNLHERGLAIDINTLNK